jgi:fructan beta-fructosidase
MVLLINLHSLGQQDSSNPYKYQFRPQLHFSPKEKWTNDPNGMVYYHGVYHLFFQYYPNDIVWGPMHWGHAISRDLIHWEQLPIALYPDSLGYIFSGSAVVDSNNTSGFGQGKEIPLVSIFTHHDPEGEKKGTANYQNQSIAYSLDEGRTWVKYKNNPVLNNPGITDFRDPHVMWYAPTKSWIMALATKDCITFYSSPDLKNWKKKTEFGKERGAHGGVWECPDLFPLQLEGKTYWVLIVSINPGGPNGGSGTQYFVGQFDGIKFQPMDNEIKWIDYGPDDYAGVTWNNTGSRKIFLGWMSNWDYANQVPTREWRNAMTIPRELKLQRSGGGIYLSSLPVKEVSLLKSKTVTLNNLHLSSSPVGLSGKFDPATKQYMLEMITDQVDDLSIQLSNDKGEKLEIGYDKASRRYYIDRTRSGRTDFNKEFAKKYFSPRLSPGKNLNLVLLVDASSVELFADKGLTVMTAVLFPEEPLTKIALQSAGQLIIKRLSGLSLRSIWLPGD